MLVKSVKDYRVLLDPYREICGIVCAYCQFRVSRTDNIRGTDRSGLPRYGRMRAKMVHHLHTEHRDQILGNTGTKEE